MDKRNDLRYASRIAVGIKMFILLLAGSASATTVLTASICSGTDMAWAGTTCTVSGIVSMSDITIPNGITLEITSSGSITFGDYIRNSGTIINSGTINNFQTIYNYLDGTITNSGTIINYGYNDLMYTYGYIINEGTIINYGTFLNEGTINNHKPPGQNQNPGIINNIGVIDNSGILYHSGIINNNAGGTITNSDTIDFEGYGIISNEGTINNIGYFHYGWSDVFDNVGGTIYNCGGTINGNIFFPNIAVVTGCITTTVPAHVDVKPDTLNKASQSDENTVTAYIEIPGYDVNSIDVSTVTLGTSKGKVTAQLEPTVVGDYDGDGIPDAMVKFDRQAVIEIVDIGKNTLTVSGTVAGETFEGSDEIRVMNNNEVPEFPTIALPIATIIGLLFLFQRRKG